ncbi:MAG: hypothetical protein PUF12_02530 [Thermoflexaceae bacterium]|nr:hypothetical protein [Thermoflexaceae bacterium]
MRSQIDDSLKIVFGFRKHVKHAAVVGIVLCLLPLMVLVSLSIRLMGLVKFA